MSRFDSVSLAPADPILSLTESFKADPNPDKINLSVGVFVDDSGKTPILDSAREAESRINTAATSKSYLPITGSREYATLTQQLCFGKELAASLSGSIVTAQSPGGTGALRVAADFIAANLKPGNVWLSNPTWANHKGIFSAAGLATKTYAYFDMASLSLEYDAFIESLKGIPEGDIVILHGCCHNPTGADLSPSQWDEVVSLASQGGWIPLLDFAYQGFGVDLEADAYAARALAQAGGPAFIAQSFSKNFGLYQDRVGALHVLTGGADEAQRVASQVKIAVRTNYSNPPAHGGAIVQTILSDAALTAQWEDEVAAMRDRINRVRSAFVSSLANAGVSQDFNFIKEQKGMFSFTGLNKEQAIELREKYSIYIVDSGRINVAGLTSDNLPRVAEVLKTLIG